MRMLEDKRGQMRVVEVILASFVLAAAVTFINVFVVTPRSSTYEVGDLEKLGYNILHNLDEQRLLSRFVYNQTEWTANLTNALRVSLPPSIYYDLTIRDLNGNVLNQNVPIRYGDSSVFSKSNSTASVTYAIVGYTSRVEAQYDPRILVLLMVRG